MKDKFLMVYIYLLIIVAIINIVIGSLYRFYRVIPIKMMLYAATVIEFPLIILSIALIIYISTKKLNNIYLPLPLFYLIMYAGLAVYGALVSLQGIDPFDMTYFSNEIIFIITELFYVLQIIFGIYLLKK